MNMSDVPVHFTVVTNFVLAFIPFVLACYLFKFSHHRTVLWWLIVPVFILFLPNSAYVLTDIIHFIAAVKSPDISTAELLLVFVPFYIVFLSVNFEFYVLSVKWSHEYLQKIDIAWLRKVSKFYVPLIHFLCALGVYLGRVQRLESYDILHKPMLIFKDIWFDLTHAKSELIILLFFVLYYVMYFAVLAVNKKIAGKFTLTFNKPVAA